jgi:transcriptional regulator with XRE-family HTH domain
MSVNYEKLGKRIKSARKARNFTQEDLAEKMGLSSNYISNIERSSSKPSLDTLVDICNFLEVTADYVLLDSVYASKEMMMDEIALKLKKCSDKNIRLISSIITTILQEQEEEEKKAKG